MQDKLDNQHKLLMGLFNLMKLYRVGLLCNDNHLHSKDTLTHTLTHTTGVFTVHVIAWLDQHRYATD